jgi:phage-related protein
MFTLMFDSYSFPNQTFEIDGLPIENLIQEDQIARKHGSVIATPYLRSRNISVQGMIHDSNADTSYSQLAAMQQALLPSEGKFYYRSDRYINCKTKSIKTSFKPGTDKAVIDVDLALVAENPFQYSAGASYSTAVTTNGTTNSFSVFNGGNVDSEPIFRVCAVGGTIADHIQLSNLTRGEVWRFRGTLSSGLTLDVNMEDFSVNNDGVDGMSYFEGDWSMLSAGTNSFQFVGMTARVTVEYKYRWY